MTPTQTVHLVHLIRATCPHQHLDEHTPDAWFPLLSDLDLPVVISAVHTLAREQNYISPADIRRTIRTRLSNRNDEVIEMPHDLDPDDTAAYIRALAEGRRRQLDEDDGTSLVRA